MCCCFDGNDVGDVVEFVAIGVVVVVVDANAVAVFVHVVCATVVCV